jgi:hypothetical protein
MNLSFKPDPYLAGVTLIYQNVICAYFKSSIIYGSEPFALKEAHVALCIGPIRFLCINFKIVQSLDSPFLITNQK